MFVFLDVGFTLMGGPATGPAGRLIQNLGLPPTAKDFLNHLLFATPMATPEELAHRLSEQYNLGNKKIFPFIRELWENQASEAYELPGARETLERLSTANIPFGFITNLWAPFLEGFSRLFPAEYRERPLFASFQQGCAKPDKELYLTALRHTGTPPDQAIMVGDTYETDIAPAAELGIKTIWILTRPDKERADLVAVLNGEKPKPHLTLAHIGKLHPEHLTTVMQPNTCPREKP